MCRFARIVGALFEWVSHSACPTEMPRGRMQFFEFGEFLLEFVHACAWEGVGVELGRPILEKRIAVLSDLEVGGGVHGVKVTGQKGKRVEGFKGLRVKGCSFMGHAAFNQTNKPTN